MADAELGKPNESHEPESRFSNPTRAPGHGLGISVKGQEGVGLGEDVRLPMLSFSPELRWKRRESKTEKEFGASERIIKKGKSRKSVS